MRFLYLAQHAVTFPIPLPSSKNITEQNCLQAFKAHDWRPDDEKMPASCPAHACYGLGSAPISKPITELLSLGITRFLCEPIYNAIWFDHTGHSSASQQIKLMPQLSSNQSLFVLQDVYFHLIRAQALSPWYHFARSGSRCCSPAYSQLLK